MYTRCPACQTVFHLRAEQLNAAHGQVRCGDCGEIFQSLNFLYDDPDAALSDTPAETPPARTVAESPGEAETRGVPPESPAARSLGDVLADHAQGFDTPKAADNEIESPVYDDPVAESQHDTVIAQEHVAREGDAARESIVIGEEHADQGPTEDHAPPRFDIPPEFILESPPQREWTLARAASWAAAFMLVLTLLGQGIYAARGKLAEDPATLPWVAKFCSVLDCDLPFSRDVGGIQIVERQVREHPGRKNALLVHTTFVNTSSFVQPWPILELRLADLSGGLVAGRRFLPSEYLQENANVKAGLPPAKPVSIELELVQPDIKVVSYQFDFL